MTCCGTASAAALLDEALAGHLLPPERISVPEWADRHRMGVAKSKHAGPWRSDLAPHIAEPMLDFTSPDIRSVCLMFPPQTAKTECMLNCLFWCIATHRNDAMWVLDSKDQVDEFSKSRMEENIRLSPVLADLLSDRAHDTQITSIKFRTRMTLWMLGAGSPGRLSNKPIRFGFWDEIDKWRESVRAGGRQEGSALELARKRLSSWGDLGREILASTPTLEHTGIHAEYLKTGQSRRWYPCPRCERWQVLEFRRLRWNGGDGSGMAEGEHAEHSARVLREAWYECRHCRGRIENRDRAAMLRRGKYLQSHQEVTRSGAVGPAPLETDRTGYACSMLDVLGHPWGAVPRAFVDRRGMIDQDFVNSYLGEPWREPGSGTDANQLTPVVVEAIRLQTPYRLGRAPGALPGAGVVSGGASKGPIRLLLGAIDVQRDHVWIRVQGFGPPLTEAARAKNRATRYLIDEWRAPWPEAGSELPGADEEDGVWKERLLADHRAAVLEAIHRRYQYEDGGDLGPVDWWAIDSGFRTGEVYELCKAGGPHCIPVKGADQQAAFIVPTTAVERLAPKKRAGAQLGDMTLLLLHTLHWKNEINRIVQDPDLLRYPLEYDPTLLEAGGDEAQQRERRRRAAYLRQMVAEHRVRIFDRGRIFKGERWVMRPGRHANHLFDCAYMLEALFWHMTRGRQDWYEVVERRSEGPAAPRPRGVRRGTVRRG